MMQVSQLRTVQGNITAGARALRQEKSIFKGQQKSSNKGENIHTYSTNTSQLASICGIINIESLTGIMQEWADSTGSKLEGSCYYSYHLKQIHDDEKKVNRNDCVRGLHNLSLHEQHPSKRNILHPDVDYQMSKNLYLF